MITAIVKFRLSPGEDEAGALAEIVKTIPLYQQAGPALIRKQISIDAANGVGCSVYLWRDRASAEAFFRLAKAHIKAKTGHEPEVQLMETQVVVDNASDDVIFATPQSA